MKIINNTDDKLTFDLSVVQSGRGKEVAPINKNEPKFLTIGARECVIVEEKLLKCSQIISALFDKKLKLIG